MQGQVFGVNTFFLKGGQMLNFASSGQNILDLKRGPGLSLEDWAEGWRAEAKNPGPPGRGPGGLHRLLRHAPPEAKEQIEQARRWLEK
ncbi:MAG: hypothetical protein WBV23_06310 [Desulfobaccales bacterium]